MSRVVGRKISPRAGGSWSRLVQVLPQFPTLEADFYAVYPQRHQMVARVRSLVDFIAVSLNQQGARGGS